MATVEENVKAEKGFVFVYDLALMVPLTKKTVPIKLASCNGDQDKNKQEPRLMSVDDV